MPLYKIVILGEGGVGKSCLTIQFTQNHFVREYDPTIENSYRKQITVNDDACMLDILDTAGQEEYSVMRDQYINSGQGFIVVYSITSMESFEAIPELREKILQVKDAESFPMVLVGNKCDLEKHREVAQDKGANLAQAWNIPFFESSAKARINIDEAFFAVVKKIRETEESDPHLFDNSPTRRPGKKGCMIL
mmetsp:Transcript_13466/g.34374  ORF Transcript_13466/g.34374 Transcript_13466/m.34374 type:complete len:192 (+) Transcript_13466:441-1016(+)|eukprot:CAMPEP_0177649704 /NCGR_PEP_ID=MMETSP0447-20121125/11536_1 /TAXON_ID=0 /ORGANISM="Stygamoeba regulata, Strain BSH-02190019" /LENGTH=191 /DNA_ID=CAMNT_0019152495 /DNA_START=641 /DNA_END=1216 /DNA_ORIENTATION=-